MKPVEPTAERSRPGESGAALASFARRALVAACVAAAVAAVLLLLWHAVDVLLLVFAGLVFGVFLRGLTRALDERAGLGRGRSLAVLLVALVGVVVLAVWLLAGRVAAQANELAEQLPRAVESSPLDLFDHLRPAGALLREHRRERQVVEASAPALGPQLRFQDDARAERDGL